MLRFLFRRLTASPSTGAALFDSLTSEARRPHWYIEGKVPDTLDGRFAVLASLTALALVRLEQEGEQGNAVCVVLTERFIEVMESEHRELGLGDPSLGKTVRKLVGMLGRRTELWRTASAGGISWTGAVRKAIYGDGADSDALLHSTAAIERFGQQLKRTDLVELEQGKIA